MSVGDLITSGPLLLAVPIALAAGLVSFLSPCCLPLVPGYLGYVAGTTGAEAGRHDASADVIGRILSPRYGDNRPVVTPGSGTTLTDPVAQADARVGCWSRTGTGRTLAGATLFVLGFSAVFTSYGALFGAAGQQLLAHQVFLTRALGLVTVVLGLLFAGAFVRVPLANRTLRLPYRPKAGLVGAPALGVLFGIGWTPCIGPTLAAVLALSASASDAGRGALLAFVYGLGLGVPFLFAAVGAHWALATFAFARRHARVVMRAGGGLLILVGLAQVTGLWSELIVRLQTLITGWQTPL